MKYWKNQGTYEAEAAELEKLVPTWGQAETLKGEIWRAATKIYYDHFNNGFGNFWVEPAAFLMAHVELPEHIQSILFDHADGIALFGMGFDDEMDEMLDTVIAALRDIEDRPNDQDMWEFTVESRVRRKFAEYEEEEEEDWDWEEDWDLQDEF